MGRSKVDDAERAEGRLRRERIKRGLSYGNVVELVGLPVLSEFRLSLLEGGIRAREDEVAALAKFYGLPAAELFSEGQL